MTHYAQLKDRALLRVSADDDAQDFLQGLVTNDIKQASDTKSVYACLLTPQGKFLHDFFIFKGEGAHEYLLDCAQTELPDLMAKLAQYKLRANVDLGLAGTQSCFVFWGNSNQNSMEIGIPDPRHAEMGTRLWTHDKVETSAEMDTVDAYNQHRIALGIPDGQRDIKPGLGGVQENNIDLLHGLSFDKGCYIGQEVVARIHYRGLLKKRLIPFTIIGDHAPKSGDFIQKDEKKIGEIKSISGKNGLAMVKLDALAEDIHNEFLVDNGKINISVPHWLKATVFEGSSV